MMIIEKLSCSMQESQLGQTINMREGLVERKVFIGGRWGEGGACREARSHWER